jgi:serine/threonine-protein kinase RsbW
MSALIIQSTPAKLRLSMACALEKVRPVTRTVRDFLIEQEVPEEEVMSCELALVEACNNAVLYADEDALRHPVEIEIVCDESKIQLRVDDHTEGFEMPAEVDLPPDDRESGRGLFIIKSMMDNVQYFRARTATALS